MIVSAYIMWVGALSAAGIAYSAEPLDSTQENTLRMIAEANRANRSAVTSFYCHYEWRRHLQKDDPSQVIENHKVGEYAFAGNKLTCREHFRSTDLIHDYVRSGGETRQRTSYADQNKVNTFSMSSNPNAHLPPSIDDPWAQIDGGITLRLDNLRREDGRVVSVEKKDIDGTGYYVVNLLRPFPLPDGKEALSTATLCYSLEHGNLPARFTAKADDLPGGLEGFSATGTVSKIETRTVDGNLIYVPLKFEAQYSRNDRFWKRTQFDVDPNSIKINVPLPEELFTLEAQEGDRVYNYDLGMEIKGVGGRVPIQSLLAKTIADMTPDVSHSAGKIALGQISLSDDVILELVHVPQGQFMMGSPKKEIGYPEPLLARVQNARGRSRPENEGPLHTVEINSPFYMGKYEVTCRQYRCFKPSYLFLPHEGRKLDDDGQPALVSWIEATAFCKWVSQKTGRKVRLPSETEWEYACRAGSRTRFFWGEDEKSAGEYANLADRTYARAMRGNAYALDTVDRQVVSCGVGKFKPNAFGLYDMLGNASEWCENKYFDNAYDPSSVKSVPSKTRVYRGGGWSSDITTARCAARKGDNPNSPRWIGFRVLVEDEKLNK